MKALLLAVLLSPASAAGLPAIGCTPVAAEWLKKEDFAAPSGAGASVPKLAKDPGVTWDLGEKRNASLGVYLTRECALGVRTRVTGGFESSSPDPRNAVENLAGQLGRHAPDWTFSVTPPNTLALSRDGVAHTTDLRKLLQIRLDAGTDVVLGGVPVRAVFDGWLLFLVPPDASKAVNLSVRSTLHPWAVYDLAAAGLGRLAVRYDEDKAVLYPLP
ncbi:MAG: hypothetical protein M0D55_00320 [Elusimicrobiota bacterium]|nr:MAG: hypothetical protein M0D55_00320 [Elusimicrobiota bacterium]